MTKTFAKDMGGTLYVVPPYPLLQIETLKIDNFKGFQDFEISLNPFTVVIGDNASGKSSLLQALAFLRYCCIASAEVYLKERNVTVDDLASKGLSKVKRSMGFTCCFRSEQENLIWELSFLLDKTHNTIKLQSEKVTVDRNGSQQVLLRFSGNKGTRIRREENGREQRETVSTGAYPCSLIKFVDDRTGMRNYPYLMAIKYFFQQSEPLDLLTPVNMRKTVREKKRTMGINGEKLPSLIQMLSSDELARLQKELQHTLPVLQRIKAVSGRYGWTHLETEERFGNRPLNVSAAGISDGTLRLLALYALPFLQKRGGITLLDEIEDGINTSHIERFLHFLTKYSEEYGQQILLTTHSTVALDEIAPDNIRYLYRDIKGNVRCKNFAEIKRVQEQLKFFYPGEIVLNTPESEMINDEGTNHD